MLSSKKKVTYPPVIKFKRSWSSTWILTFFTFPFADAWAFALSEVITGWISFPTFYSFRSRGEACVGRVILALITLQKQIPLHINTRIQDGQFPHLIWSRCFIPCCCWLSSFCNGDDEQAFDIGPKGVVLGQLTLEFRQNEVRDEGVILWHTAWLT